MEALFTPWKIGNCEIKNRFHSFFNLGGQGNGTILDEKIRIVSDSYAEIGEGAIPTGNLPSVEGTALDLRTLKRIGDRIDDDFDQLNITAGYDHNWCLSKDKGSIGLAAYVEDDRTGLTMEVYTDLPGLQFYAGNALAPHKGKGGIEYQKRGGLCLETQYYPDNIHHDNFDSSLIDAGIKVTTKTVYRFGQL